MTYRIILEPLAEEDLALLRDWIAAEAGTEVARSYLDRVERKFGTPPRFRIAELRGRKRAQEVVPFRSKGDVSSSIASTETR